MEHKYLKGDLIKVLIFNLLIIIILVSLAIWDKHSGILGKIGENWLK